MAAVAELGSLGVSARMRPYRIVALVVGMLALGCLASYLLGLPVSRSQLSSLRVGMAKDEVMRILGQPKTVHTPVGGAVWVYESPYHLFAVEVSFDGIGRYERYWKEP